MSGKDPKSKVSLLSGLHNKIFNDDAEMQPPLLSARSKQSAKLKPNRPSSANAARINKKQKPVSNLQQGIPIKKEQQLIIDDGAKYQRVEKYISSILMLIKLIFFIDCREDLIQLVTQMKKDNLSKEHMISQLKSENQRSVLCCI
jgi:hypothetical protein